MARITHMARSCFLVLIVALWMGYPRRAEARFRQPELEEVPIERLLNNLGARLETDTNSWNVHYQLARLHSMVYASNATNLQIVSETGDLNKSPWSIAIPDRVLSLTNRESEAATHLSNAITHYQKSLALIGTPTMKQDSFWGVLPVNLGLAWCLDQAGRRPEAIKAYRKTLQLALLHEIGRDSQSFEWVEAGYDEPGTNHVKVITNSGGMSIFGPAYYEETIRYLTNLLDPVKDAKEISQLQAVVQATQGANRAVTPILVPLTRDGALKELIDPVASVAFDLDGSGVQRRWGWITPKAAWLVSDPHRTGRITSGLQLFGNVTFWIFWRDGYEALASLDDNNDGVLKGAELEGLALWQDINSNGVSEPGEVRPLAEFGITALRCRSQVESAQGPWHPQGVEYGDGRTAPSYDWISTGEPMEGR